MAVEPGSASGPPEEANILVEYEGGGGNEDEAREEAYEEAWQIANEKTLQGWSLRGMEATPEGIAVALIRDQSGGQQPRA